MPSLNFVSALSSWFVARYTVRLSVRLSVTLVDCDHIVHQKVAIGT